MRVPDFLADQHVPFEPLVHAPAFTAQKRADFLRIPGRYVMKSVVLVTGRGSVVAVLPATRHVDLALVAAALETDVRLATEEECVALFGDCERGALAPFGRLYGLTTLLDASLQPDDVIVFEAQRHGFAIRMRIRDFEHIEQPRRVELALPQCTQARSSRPGSQVERL